MTKPYDQILTVDFETRWSSKDYTLSKMTTEEYIRDERFTAFGAAFHVYGSDQPIEWVRGPDLPQYLSAIDWSRTAVLAHNAQFDISILSWRSGIRPAFIFDTLSMARALRGVEAGNSLAKLADAFGLPAKGRAVHSTDGLSELDTATEEELAQYCKHDVFLCEEIFRRLSQEYPTKELRLIDLTLRMYTHPLLELDHDMLQQAIREENENRAALLKELRVDEEALASNPKFAALLEKMGVEAPTKISPTTGEKTFALAKNDALFQSLLNHKRDDIALLCEARLQVKSTSVRTRAQRFLGIAERGRLPVPLTYYGAKSGRWTAAKGSAINMQNLKRGSYLRSSIMAPEGHQLVVVDLSQIEPRVSAWLTDYEELLAVFRAGGDPYAQFGAQMFGIPNLNKKDHPIERQAAKAAMLGAGYNLGWASFAMQTMVGVAGGPPTIYDKQAAKQLGVTPEYIERFLGWDANVERMQKIPHNCTDKEFVIHCVASKKIIDKYRATAHPVVSFWGMCDRLIETALYGGEEFQYKCLTFKKEEIVLPSGMSVRYPNLRREKDRWVYDGEKGGKTVPTDLYGGKVTNNVVQGTARCVFADGMLRVDKRYPVVGTVHDEIICVVPDAEAEEAKAWALEQMVKAPTYLPGIPVNAEAGAHRRYGLAKN